jgi:cytidylate kinase
MAIILGFSGKRGSGKSTISCRVAGALGWGRTSFGDYVRGAARRRGLAEDTATLQAVGESLVAKGPETFCRAVLREAGWTPGSLLVVDGLRHMEVINGLREVISPADLRLVYIEVDESVRASRLSERDKANVEEIRQYDRHSTESQVETQLRAHSDLILDGSEPEDDTVDKIVQWVRRLTGSTQ